MRAKMNAWQIGRKLSEDHKNKLSKIKTGNIQPLEAIRKRVEAKRNRPRTEKEKDQWNEVLQKLKGTNKSDEHRKNISLGKKR